MAIESRRTVLSISDTDHCKRLVDPIKPGVTFHMEALLPFSEAVKLPIGNANVRTFSESKKPFKDMLETVHEAPYEDDIRPNSTVPMGSPMGGGIGPR